MRRIGQRTGYAVILTAVAILIPCVAWFVAGSRAVDRDAEQLARAPLAEAAREAQRMSQQLAVRLEALRHSESQRSHRDYQMASSDLPADCNYELLIQSPLAEGPTDPLIWSHFQIDDVGDLSLPTLVGSLGDIDRETRANQLAIQEELQCASAYRLASRQGDYPASKERLVHDTDGVTTIGPFVWSSATLKGEPALVALREVVSTGATLTQGFVILASTLEEQLTGAPFPVELRPGSILSDGETLLVLDDETWIISLDAGEALELAAEDALSIRRRFYLSFFGGTLAALLAGGLLVGLVWQSESLARRRAQFAASAAHELRTPLAGMRLYAEMLSEGFGDPSKRAEYARRIGDESERLGRVVTNVLGYTRLERGNLRLNAELGDLGNTVRDSVSRLGPALEAKGARLELRLCEDLDQVRFDAEAVHQILQNLLDNAERYSREARDRTIRVQLESTPRGPTLSVVDHGQGVAPAVRRRLFQPFERSPDPRAPAGLGIGLSLVRSLADAQNAVVSHADELGGGSRFTVTFQGC